MAEFVAAAAPLEALEGCLVSACPRQRTSRRGLCAFHASRLRRERGAACSIKEVAAWAAHEPPRLGAHQFSLAALSETVRLELRYCLEQRDHLPPPLDPLQVRIVVGRLVGVTSVRTIDVEAVCVAGGLQYNAAAKGLLRDLGRHVELAWSRFTGADPYAGDRWKVGPLELFPNGSRRYPARTGVVDFAPIGEVWLREVAKAWARATRPYLQNLRQAIKACAVASSALASVGRSDPSMLGAGEFSRVLDTITLHRRADGSLYSASFRNVLLYRFKEIADFGRANGLMAEVPDTFCSPRRRRVTEEPNEDQIGKALPDVVIRQLDDHLHLLGPRGRMGPIAAGDLQAMHQVIYQLLRDTGRRPGEVASLEMGCLEVIEGHHNLIYDNHKAGRLRRRLPITANTATVIREWAERRRTLAVPPSTDKWLFPSPLLRATRSAGHLTAAGVGAGFRSWVRTIPVIDGEVLQADGSPAPFDRHRITLYALRHTYAQRHADAGVPVDVLRELLTHVSVQTTMGYYSISLQRKRHAIAVVGALALDANGEEAAFTDPVAYERASVSVPFGNCTEPSHVKAGGGHCPIRFQCAGCSFYRPDPSYLPALEEHVASLRADLETAVAMDAASHVRVNLYAEIDAFSRVAKTMRRHLDALGPEERAEVEEASRVLRRTRAARRIPLVVEETG
jgi:integrase